MKEKPEEFYLFSDMDLLPCPLCGAKAKPSIHNTSLANGWLSISFFIKCSGEKHCVSSSKSYFVEIDTTDDGDIVITKDERQSAQDDWNKREGSEYKSEIQPLESLDLSVYKKPELLPCPVCGKKAEFFIVNKATKSLLDRTLPLTGFLFGIRCPTPFCLDFKSRESVDFDVFTDGRVLVKDRRNKLQKEWNTRHSEDIPSETENRIIESQTKHSDELLKNHLESAHQAEEERNTNSRIFTGLVIACCLIAVIFLIASAV